jgi:hypothetical protein
MVKYSIVSYGPNPPGPEVQKLQEDFYPEASIIHIPSGEDLSLEKFISVSDKMRGASAIVLCFSNFSYLPESMKRWDLKTDVLYIHGYFVDYNSESMGSSPDRLKICSGSGAGFIVMNIQTYGKLVGIRRKSGVFVSDAIGDMVRNGIVTAERLKIFPVRPNYRGDLAKISGAIYNIPLPPGRRDDTSFVVVFMAFCTVMLGIVCMFAAPRRNAS